ncbi:hypothetical protein UFOVP371_48 [uncultured Caudovirales phage]|uniref:Portal protein n=1 Tax=uncultured Caudovirales phage TaxID=2100421 RepID=A0A6J7X422_9CAUD|nr:hypothetical protein UFOVP371_48 [uncultured Caudovirales phage]
MKENMATEKPVVFDKETNEEKEIVEWVVGHLNRWRDYRDVNFLPDWEEYERIFRGQWASEDKTRESERSRIISPATQQAVETRHAEVIEAIFGQGDFFDIKDDIKDVDGNPMDVEAIKQLLVEDFKRDKIKKSIDHIELMAEIYGTGIGEISVSSYTEYKPATQAMPNIQGMAAIGVQASERTCVKLKPVNPKNFLIDPNADSIEEAMGCAIEKYVSIHKIVEGMEKGIYKKVDISTSGEDSDLEPTQELSYYQDDKVRLITYYGLVPREYLTALSGDTTDVVDLFPEDSVADEYSDMVEAIIVIANDSQLLKAEESPYMMKDRPVVAYQDDTVPGRFYGRGTVEKAYNMQKAIDGQLRAHMDSLALTTAPMVAMDATRLPRGAKFEVKPGKMLLTNGPPSEIVYPFHFGQSNQDAPAAAQNFERMLLQATGTVDSAGLPSATQRDGQGQGMSMAMAGVIKKYKRTLVNFQEDFMIPFIYKAAYRYMQFDPERYPSVDMTFIPTATLGVLAREYEQQQMIGLLQTLGPDTPVLPVILKGIFSNSSFSNRAELMATLDQMSQPSPEAQQAAQEKEQMQMQLVGAQTADLQTKAQKQAAEAQQIQVDTQLAPQLAQAKLTAALATNLDDANETKDFERRARITELMLKEKDLSIKEQDSIRNERITMLQMNKNA